MRIVISEFISLDGVVQAPGAPDEDTDGGFRHGGRSMPFFDPEVMGSAIDEVAGRTDALLDGRRTWQVMGSAQLVRSLLATDLVDEMNLMIEPIALGGGTTIFPTDGAARRFELVSAATAGTGVQVCRYRRAGEG